MKNLFYVKSLILITILAVAIACNSTGKKSETKVDDGKVSKVEVSISGMTCSGCEQTVQTSISKLEGIKSVKALATMGKAFIEFSPSLTDTARIRTAITESGYSVTGFEIMMPAEPGK